MSAGTLHEVFDPGKMLITVGMWNFFPPSDLHQVQARLGLGNLADKKEKHLYYRVEMIEPFGVHPLAFVYH